ncbi:unnamed protein product [Rotaria sp. Silwood1]|nr:unnamed protein product [Rotaria sp. Silwood1]
MIGIISGHCSPKSDIERYHISIIDIDIASENYSLESIIKRYDMSLFSVASRGHYSPDSNITRYNISMSKNKYIAHCNYSMPIVIIIFVEQVLAILNKIMVHIV